MNFELTISGLCVIVLKSKDDKPENPAEVEVLCPDAHGHKPRLSYRPEGVITEVEPDLFIDPQGGRIASLDLTGKVLSLDLGTNPHTKFSLDWGTGTGKVPPEEKWMRWVPSDQDLGLKGIRLAKPGTLPKGASARLALQPGNIEARAVVRTSDTKDYILWNFPAKNFERALANEVVYSARGVQHVKVLWGTESLFVSRTGTLEMAISNDLAIVPKNYNEGVKKLEHLSHVEVLAEPPAKVNIPIIVEVERTGRPICNQLIFVDKSD
jgi:hypothetical protein